MAIALTDEHQSLAETVAAFWDAGQRAEPRNRQPRCRSQGFEVREGT
jgi:hypothetical protein